MTQAWSIARAMKRAVLIADDHPLFRDALKLAVAQAVPGAQIVEADTVHSLFAALDAHPDPELLLLDLNMPRMNGRQTLMHLKNDARYSDIAVIIYSTSINPVEKEICMAQGAQAYIAKPVSYTESIETAKLFISLCDAKTPA